MRPRLITFDCYGTLVDWNRGIAGAFRTEAKEHGVDLAESAVLAAYHDVEPEVEGGEFRSYRKVLAETAVRVAERLDWRLDPVRAGFLARTLPDWPVFPCTNAALERLNAAGYRLGILSNVDDDLLAGTMRQFTVAFDFIVTAERVHSYKPASPHFDRALDEVDGDPARLLHIAGSYYHDVRPARDLGIPTIWVNRGDLVQPPGPEPSFIAENLDAAIGWVEAR